MIRKMLQYPKKPEGTMTNSRIARKLSYKFTQDEAYIQNEIQRFAKATLLLKLKPEHICGKIVQES